MDNLLNDDVYYEKLDVNKLFQYIDSFQTIVLELINEHSNYHNKYIYIGIKTVMHVMHTIFISTKNIDITTHYGKISITYYFEFINHICSNTNSFVNLSLNDAIIFVYKKTIFNLKTEYKRRYNNIQDDKTFHLIFTVNKNE